MTMHPANDTAPPPSTLAWTIVAGATFGLAALIAAPLAGLELSWVIGNDDGHVTWLIFLVGVFLTGCFFWWLIMSRPRRFSPGRGAVTGVLVALFSYPVILLLAEIVQRNWQVNADSGTYLARLFNVLIITGLTLLTTGFAASLIMALAGALIAWVMLRVDPRVAAATLRGRRGSFLRSLFKVVSVLAVLIVLCLTGTFIWLSLMPLQPLVPSQPSNPARSYDEAIAAFGAVTAKETETPLHPRCHSTLLTHGQKAVRAVIFFHGLTNCPAQADELALMLYALGYNVYIPRLPGHGEADPLTLSLADMSAEDLVDTANISVDLAQGLGDEVVVVGLSAGGTMSSWLTQQRSDVGNAISVSPFLGPHVVPPWANHAAINLILMLPNMMVWWNPRDPMGDPSMDYAYPRYATHALGQVLRLGELVGADAREAPPQAQNIAMLLNEADDTVSNALAQKLIAAWRDHGREVSVETLPLDRALPHDLIDPREAEGDVDFVYPVLIDMISPKAGQP